MTDKANKPSDLHSVEGDLFGAVFGFHRRVVALLRAANLDDDKLNIAAERIESLMTEAKEHIEATGDLNIQPRLDSMYEEVKRLMDELSDPPG
jgi:hypothetical protein